MSLIGKFLTVSHEAGNAQRLIDGVIVLDGAKRRINKQGVAVTLRSLFSFCPDSRADY